MQKNDLVFRTIVEDVGKFIQVIHLTGSYFLVHGCTHSSLLRSSSQNDFNPFHLFSAVI